MRKAITNRANSSQYFKSMKYGNVSLGRIEALLNKIGGEDGMMAILSGRATIAYIKHIINLDADPRTPYEGWSVEEHKKGGQFEWNSEKVKLFLSESQKTGSIEGHKLRKELADQPVFNANILDYLLDNPRLIPEEWKEKMVFFWGTIYRDSDGNLFVRYLVWRGGSWEQSYSWLVNAFDTDDPAVVSARYKSIKKVKSVS